MVDGTEYEGSGRLVTRLLFTVASSKLIVSATGIIFMMSLLLDISVSPICLARMYLVGHVSIAEQQPFHQSFITYHKSS